MSEKLLPIVPGCRAILLSTANPVLDEFVGQEVLVIEAVVTMIGSQWRCTSASIACKFPIHKTALALEHRLMRIDGGEFSHEKDSHELGIKA